MVKDEIKDILIRHNIKPSIQRLIIFEYLYENKNHPTVETIFNAISKKIPTLSKATIYNTMQLFIERGIVQALNIEENETRYDAYIEPHIHFKCVKCGKIFDLEPGDNKFFNLDEVYGNKILQKRVYFIGICKDCLKQE